MTQKWHDFPHENRDYEYPGEALAEAWPVLHRGDREPFPDLDWITQCLEDAPHAAPSDFDGNVNELSERLQSAWCDFHAGRFSDAVRTADRCGWLGAVCANKATGIYATYLEDDSRRQQACFQSAIDRAAQAIEQLPQLANSHYFHAFNLGRLSQNMSVMDALRQGLGGKIHASLEQTLAIEPEHAEAHTALGMYHAEVINKVGKMIGSMTYGASVDLALEHFQRAVALTPESPIAHIEYGNGLYLLYGDRELDQVTELYVKASELAPHDAMERLDVEAALAELE